MAENENGRRGLSPEREGDMKSLAEVADVGMKRFEEYAEKHKLKVKGIERYDASTVKEKKKGIAAPLSRLTEDIVKDAVDEVLDELAKVGEFTMSERDAMWDVQTEPRRHGNLRMTFEHGRDSKDNSVLWIYCWYYPTRK